MPVIIFRMAAPLQSWGDSSRFSRRDTRMEPTKSGIVGMIASAMGRSREDEVSDLAELELAVRTEQPGELLRDFQTEITKKGRSMPLSNRYYLQDAVFLVGLAGDGDLLKDVTAALEHPRRPLYLGRRSGPAGMIRPTLYEDALDVRALLEGAEWQPADWYRQRQEMPKFLEIACDGREGERCSRQMDYPLSFSGVAQRAYASRPVRRYRILNPSLANASEELASALSDHDPMDF